MKKNYITPELETVETLDVVTTSREVETEPTPFHQKANPTGVGYGADNFFNV